MNLFFPRVRCGKWVGNVVVDQTLRATTPQRIERRGSSGAHSRIGSYCPKELRKMERVEHFDVPSRSILSKKLNPLGDDVVTGTPDPSTSVILSSGASSPSSGVPL